MASSGVPPQFPKAGQYRSDTQQQRGTETIASKNQQAIGKIEHASAEIRAEITAKRQEIRAQGEVTQVKKESNSIRIATPRGEVEAQLPPDQPRPQVGQRVEVQITPPSHIVIRPDNAPQAQETDQISTRQSATPVQIEVRDGQTRLPDRIEITRPDPNAPPPVNRFPEAGSIIRLEPITPAQLEQLSDARQLATPQVITQTANPLPHNNITAAHPPLPPDANALNVTIQNLPISAEALDVSAPPLQAQTRPAAPSTIVQLVSPNLAAPYAPAVSENSISVPVLSRAQAAVVQLQNAAAGIENVSAPFTPQDVRVGNIQAADIANLAPQNPITGNNNAAQITGTVIAHTQNQIPIVQFSFPQSTGHPFTLSTPFSPVEQQTYLLQFPSDALVLGSKIHVTPQTLNNAITVSQANVVMQALPFANITFPQSWPIMTDIQQTLTRITTQAAAQSAQAFTASIPTPANTAQFGPAALFFVAAMRGGDMSSWLGDKASEVLRSAGKNSLLSRLGDLNTMTRAADAPAGEWRGMQIPLMWEGDIQKIALHYKHDREQSEDNEHTSTAGTRFLFDLNLEVMGKVQLDGFFRPVSSDGPRLDVVLRTEERFSSAMQAEMRRLYMDAIKPSQVGGALTFQDGEDAWVMIDAEDPAALGVSA